MTDLLARAEDMIVTTTGVVDWRPLFLLGLEAAVVIVVVVALTVWAVYIVLAGLYG